ncbi:glutathione S-transferase family protein [Ferrimonas marina]|uniref:glutathione transferase n=1 Tax=Ferrimonas marina TaxID=299255 RepID=A0A1M5YBE6_9GAMM|nr:glutathione S-transferase family protein [Ferrimonas marina]SHI09347.1 Glutathione S-transferase, C-terminal domain [Ferrimonas marina]
MKLYETAMTPSAQRVNLFLLEKGIQVERVSMNVRAGDNLTPEFAAKSPTGKIPLLELDDGTCLVESIAICRYFDALHPDELALFGRTPLEQAQVEMWSRVVEIYGLQIAFQAFRHTTGVYADRERCIRAWGDEALLRLKEFLPKLERRLGEADYLAGEHYSVADITAYVLVRMLPRFDIEVNSPHLARWMERIEARPAVQTLNLT